MAASSEGEVDGLDLLSVAAEGTAPEPTPVRRDHRVCSLVRSPGIAQRPNCRLDGAR